MRIDYLMYFLNVAQSKSINISAKELYISQQSLSWAIKTLEQEVGAPLFDRHYYGVELTEVGKIVAEHAGRILKEHYALRKNVLPYLEPVYPSFSGQLKIGINYHIVNELLHTIMHTFTRQNPNVALVVKDSSIAQMVSALEAGEIDIALFGDWSAQCAQRVLLPDELISEPLYEAAIIVCVSKQLPLAAKRMVTPDELLSEPLIQYADQSITQCFFAGYGTPRIAMETSSTELYRQIIQDGVGYGLTNWLDWHEDYSFEAKNQLSVIPVAHPHAAICYRLLYRRQALNDPCRAALIRIIRQRFNLLEENH